jgi:chaperonin cofactor prefoldin
MYSRKSFVQEHETVIKALEKLDPDRKCFRLVGEVLVERTVKEVLPAVMGNKEQIDMVRSPDPLNRSEIFKNLKTT